MGSNPTASANLYLSRFIGVASALLMTSCMHFASAPGETRAEGSLQRSISARVLELSQAARPDCRSRKITDTEIVDLHPDGKVSLERWTVTQCNQRARYVVSFPPTGRGTGFLVRAEK